MDQTHDKESIPVAKESFDPGYDLSTSLQEATKADLIKGYCTYGKSVGE